MQKMRNERGITLIALVITIIVLMILFSITKDLGLDSIDSTNDRKLKAELQIVQQACITEYTKAKMLGYIKDSSDSNVNEENNEENSENEEENENSDSTSNIPINFVGTEVKVEALPVLSSDISWVFSSNPPDEDYKKYFLLDEDDLELLGIDDSASTYIVNYYTGEVYNETVKVTSNGEPLYIKSVQIHQTDNNNDNTSFVDNTIWQN